ncbi:hypothetical protein HNQ47_001817 [Catenisphaera adipataccumulans]|jgi:hypothetical protein|uniref:Uncharacterized protein n=1 Tax=Catenisphaera adipataccumulans TaxID=700500 RepID=A0A7W8FWY2_9FIRM|nr:hypothetical protein [Catenisphaera adipataccumulans]
MFWKENKVEKLFLQLNILGKAGGMPAFHIDRSYWNHLDDVLK